MTNYNLKALKERINKYKVEYFFFIIVGVSMNFIVQYTALKYDIAKEKSYSNFRRKVYKLFSSCFITSDNFFLQQLSNFVKGENYVPTMTPEKNKKFRTECIVTTWNLLHFLSHLLVVFVFPYFYREIFITSFIFEIYEYFGFKCHDLSDIIYNIVGLLAGYKLRKIYDKY